jgi:hypothetical protein
VSHDPCKHNLDTPLDLGLVTEAFCSMRAYIDQAGSGDCLADDSEIQILRRHLQISSHRHCAVTSPAEARSIGRTSKTKTCVLRCFSRAPASASRGQDGDIPPPKILNQPSSSICFANQGAFGAWFPRDGSRVCDRNVGRWWGRGVMRHVLPN